jgi:hypothetical protein
MSGTAGIRVVDLPDLGSVTDTSSVVCEKSGTGRFTALALKNYVSAGGIAADAPSDSNAYGRMNAAWQRVLPLTGGALTGSVSIAGNVTASANVYCNSLFINPTNGYEWNFSLDSSGNHVAQDSANWYSLWTASGGHRSWVNPSGTQMRLDGSSNALNVHGVVEAAAFWQTSVPDGQFGFGLGGAGRIFSFRSNFYLDHSTTAGTTDGTLQYVVSNGPLWVMRASDDFCFNPQSSVGGNGAYVNSSDRRVKQNIVPTSKGLAEVLQLEPVSFTRVDPTTGAAEEIGFVAQDVQPVVPEAVWQAGIPMRDGTGGLDSTEPMLGLTSETITAISVNAIKELNALIASLTDRVAALEGAA